MELINWISDRPWAVYLALGVFTFVLGKKSQVDEWANNNPRVAGVLKLLRSVGIDPWMFLQSLSLLFKGKLPGTKLLPLFLMIAAAGASVSCAEANPVVNTINDAARVACKAYFSDRAGISLEEAAKKFCETQKQLDPWIEEFTAAQARVGAAAAEEAGVPAKSP